MLKSAPRILAIVLLVAIAVLMAIAGGDGFTKLFKDVEANDGNGGDTPPPAQNIEDEPIIVEPPVNSSRFPKQPSRSDTFLYEQSIAVNAALKLEATHQTNKGILLVVSGAPTDGDFTVERQSVTVINMSEGGTLNSCLTLSCDSPTQYVTSQLTTEGLAVAVKDDKKCYLFIVDYELKSGRQTELDALSGAKIFPLSAGFMLLAERAQSAVHLIKNGEVEKTAFIPSGNVLEIIEMRSNFIIFINGINGYSVISLDKDLTGYSNISVPGKTALKVMPATEGGAQKFLVVEHTGSEVYVAKHSATFRESDCERVYAGKGGGADIYQNGSTIFLLLKGEKPRVILLDMNLDLVASNSSLYDDIKDIYFCEGYGGGYLMLIKEKSGDKLRLTDIRNDGAIAESTINISANSANFIINLNGTVSVIYSSAKDPSRIHIAGIDL
ncbi:MAG: hypothetical protein GX095_02695 [Clostridiales bacterium]|jgi:hypothetical protein|nr:hypothetical protein [Clostridiales bacterium]HOK81179.1 hypothetical protein [Clostridia bacterium]HOL60298.1 hypothetical protein [Clostridia bacterium]HPO53831.1 hypothetical protein [Clostridia bacterium]